MMSDRKDRKFRVSSIVLNESDRLAKHGIIRGKALGRCSFVEAKAGDLFRRCFLCAWASIVLSISTAQYPIPTVTITAAKGFYVSNLGMRFALKRHFTVVYKEWMCD